MYNVCVLLCMFVIWLSVRENDKNGSVMTMMIILLIIWIIIVCTDVNVDVVDALCGYFVETALKLLNGHDDDGGGGGRGCCGKGCFLLADDERCSNVDVIDCC